MKNDNSAIIMINALVYDEIIYERIRKMFILAHILNYN